MHPGFGIDYREVYAQPYKDLSITYKGYGEFDIPIKIYWKKELGM